MRIISQDCDKDLPYESSEVIVDDKCIIAISSSLPRLMAEYSNAEKAQKAMDMLHREYTGIMPSLVIDNDSMLNQKDMKALLELPKGAIVRPANPGDIEVHMLPRVFRFPADDEIEVYHDCSHF